METKTVQSVRFVNSVSLKRVVVDKCKVNVTDINKLFPECSAEFLVDLLPPEFPIITPDERGVYTLAQNHLYSVPGKNVDITNVTKGRDHHFLLKRNFKRSDAQQITRKSNLKPRKSRETKFTQEEITKMECIFTRANELNTQFTIIQQPNVQPDDEEDGNHYAYKELDSFYRLIQVE
eukprot:TRINITY_DN1213_c0_g1_i2.p1 TRINITY_DN1213_c0_g1~~TRINITY_DN1213_c0_g1_i2.p1  ORF type:complete len:178 (+),score=9.55 TRINITY_DN1213_c0_g1_i2:27-560(+)